MSKIINVIKESLMIFTTDLKRILKNKAALFIIIGLMILPSMYAWFNISALWDPYGNASNLPIGVYSDDIGDKVGDTSFNVGDEIISNLKENGDLAWQFADSKESLEKKVELGEYYGSIYIPKDFSSTLANSLDNGFEKPILEYRVNEKVNAIAPKMTEAGAEAIYEEVSSGINAAVTESLMSVANEAGADITDNRMLLEEAIDDLAYANQNVSKIDEVLNLMPELQNDIDQATNKLNSIDAKIENGQEKLLTDLNDLNNDVKNSSLEADFESSYSDAIDRINRDIDTYNNFDTTSLTSGIDSAIKIISKISGTDDAVADLNAVNNKINNMPTINNVDKLNTSSDVTTKVSELISSAISSVEAIDTSYIDNVNSKLSEANHIVDEIISFKNNKWPTIKSTIISSNDYVSDLSDDVDLDELIDLLSTDDEGASNFMEQPIELDTITMYHVKTYGTASTPFYTTLCLWVGSLLMASLLAFDFHGNRVSKYSQYFGRMFTFTFISLVQAVIVTFGDILILGVVPTNLAAMLAFDLLIGVCFTVIIYTLVSVFGNIGKALGIIGLVLSISGGGGNFPIEVSGPFFNAIYPYLPFTYGVKLLREAIAGIYVPTIIHSSLILVVYTIGFLVFGVIGTKYLKPWFDKFDVKSKESHILH